MSMVRVGLPCSSNTLPTLFATFIALALLVGVGIPTAQAQRPNADVSRSSLTINEGGEASYAFAWFDRTRPATVTVQLRAGSSSDIRFSTSTFTLSRTGSLPAIQRVTVTAAQDADIADDMGVLVHTSPAWTGEFGPITITILDDDDLTPDFGTSTVPN